LLADAWATTRLAGASPVGPAKAGTAISSETDTMNTRTVDVLTEVPPLANTMRYALYALLWRSDDGAPAAALT
jgi:hypothetical protein